MPSWWWALRAPAKRRWWPRRPLGCRAGFPTGRSPFRWIGRRTTAPSWRGRYGCSGCPALRFRQPSRNGSRPIAHWSPEAAIGGKRLGRAAAAVERQHQRAGQFLPEGMSGGESGQVVDHGMVITELVLRVEQGLQRGQPLVFQMMPGLVDKGAAHSAEWRPGPQAQPGPQGGDGGRQLAGPGQPLPAIAVLGEGEQVELRGGHRRPVTTSGARDRLPPGGAQRPADGRDRREDLPFRRHRWRGAPQGVDQLIRRHGLVGVQQQIGQHGPPLRAVDVHRPALDNHPDRPQQHEFHQRPPSVPVSPKANVYQTYQWPGSPS